MKIKAGIGIVNDLAARALKALKQGRADSAFSFFDKQPACLMIYRQEAGMLRRLIHSPPFNCRNKGQKD